MAEPSSETVSVAPQPSRLRPWLIAGLMGFVIVEIVALSPSTLEQTQGPSTITPESLTQAGEKTLAQGIPKDKVPDYSIDGFDYVSTVRGEKQWKLLADRAYLYNDQKLVHSRRITAHLFNPDGKITIVTGNEAKYFMNRRDLEVYGDVVTQFPDGFRTHSEYLRYKPTFRKIEIPVAYEVHGDGQQSGDQELGFDSFGLDFAMGEGLITLPKAARLVMTRKGAKKPENQGVADQTRIESDRCVIFRDKNLAKFTMDSKRPLSQRFVRISQPNLKAKSRKAELNYGDLSAIVNYLTATEDVLIQETGSKSDRYATGGRADFDTKRDLIVLTDFPQVYQDNDTLTGDVILVHRDTDIVEVEHGNAYSDGQKPEPQ